MTEDQGKIIAGRYQLQSPIGSFQPDLPRERGESGGAGDRHAVPWLAFDCNLQRRVFVKLHDARDAHTLSHAHNGLWLALAQLGPPGMPAILDIGEEEDRAFLVTEWLDAVSLHELEKQVQRIGGNVRAIIESILAQSLETLAALHEAGLAHGDISPRNILVSQLGDRTWLVDPAPALPGGKQLTTISWAAPELLDSDARGPASDLYSLGSVLHAFARRTGSFAPGIVDWMMREDPAARPESAIAARQSLRNGGYAVPVPEAWGGAGGAPPLVGAPAPGWDDKAQAGGSGLWSAKTAFRPPLPGTPSSAPATGSRFVKENRPPRVQIEYDAQPDPDAGAGWSDRTSIGNVPILPKGGTEPTDADFIVMGPTIVSRERSFPLELWMGPSSNAEELRERARERGVLSERGGRSHVLLPAQTIITAVLSLPGLKVANPTEQMAWDGTIRNTAFIVHAGDGLKPGDYWGLVKLMAGTVPLGMVSFCVTIGEGSENLSVEQSERNKPMQRFRTAFASYSRTNTSEVFKRLQAIRASRVDVYVDIASLRGGERWEEALMHEIATRDVFYLFWSQEAARSSWVEREWREALDKRGLDFICPIPLEDPRFAEPPAELAGLHFNDWCLAIIRGEQALAENGATSI